MAKNTCPLEYDECKTFKAWLDAVGLKFTHIVNEGRMPVQYRMKLIRMGFSAGVPDYMIITPNGLAFVEMKRVRGSRVDPRQTEWIDALNKLPGVEAQVCRGAEDAIKFISQLV